MSDTGDWTAADKLRELQELSRSRGWSEDVVARSMKIRPERYDDGRHILLAKYRDPVPAEATLAVCAECATPLTLAPDGARLVKLNRVHVLCEPCAVALAMFQEGPVPIARARDEPYL
jgi:hypothetical protein